MTVKLLETKDKSEPEGKRLCVFSLFKEDSFEFCCRPCSVNTTSLLSKKI